MTCLCTDDRASLCCGGGLPPAADGACSCRCHGGAARVAVYALASGEPHAQLALDVCAALAGLPPQDAALAHRVLGASGLAAPLVGALLRTSLLWARARATAGLLAAGGVP